MDLNCIIIDDEPHAIAEHEELIEVTPGIMLEESFDTVAGALTYLQEKGKVDIIFCDINMPKIDGIEAASTLIEFCDFLVYVTAHRDRGAESYEAQASGYLLKPLTYDKFAKQIAILQKRAEDRWIENEADILFVKGGDKNSLIKIFLRDIIHIQGFDNYIIFHTTKGEKTTYLQLKSLENSIMRGGKFLRIGKSEIISVDFLDSVSGYVAYMTTGETFSIGKPYRPAFRNFLKKKRVN